MRRVVEFIVAFLFLPLAFALDVNTLYLVQPGAGSTVSSDFNVVWEVNASGDWNTFTIAFDFGSTSMSDGDYVWNVSVGTDYNAVVYMSDPACVPDANTGVTTCYVDFNESAVLRDGSLTITVYGYDSNGNLIDSNSVSVTLDFFNDYTAALTAYSSSGDANITLSFDCNIIEANSGSVILHTSDGDIVPSLSLSGSTIVATVSSADINKLVRGTVVELNTAEMNVGSCVFAPDTDVLVTNLPDSYLYVPAGSWKAVAIPYLLDESYAPMRDTIFNGLAVVARYTETGWDTNVSDFFDENYTFEGYYFYADSNVWVPFRWQSYQNPSPCDGSADHIFLHPGWNFVAVHCIRGVSGGQCADSNSTLITVSFVEANTGTNQLFVTVKPLYQYYGLPGSEGTDANFVAGYGAFSVYDPSPIWIWINPNWTSIIGAIRYYSECVSVPAYPTP